MGQVIQFRRRSKGADVDLTPMLWLARAAIIGWVTLSVTPFEVAFDAIEGELKRHGQL